MSPSIYQITRSKDSNSFFFSTDPGLTYTVYIDVHTNIFPNEDIDKNATYIGFNCQPKQQVFGREHDPRVGITIMAIIATLIRKNPHIIITYVCSPMDGQARQRSIAFRKWYNESPLKGKVAFFRKVFEPETYCGILCQKNHPDIEGIEIAIQDFNPGDKFALTIVEEPPEEYGNDFFEE